MFNPVLLKKEIILHLRHSFVGSVTNKGEAI